MIYLVIIIATIAADQFTKAMVVDSMHLFQSVVIIPDFFNLVYVTNTGAAFSMFAGGNSPWKHYFFLGVGAIALIGLTIFYWKLRQAHKLYAWALALIAGGAAGNLIDRVRLGSVVDFLDFYLGSYHWPAFNVADSAICVGACLYIIISFIENRNQPERTNI